MDRREAIRKAGFLVAGTVALPSWSWLLQSCEANNSYAVEDNYEFTDKKKGMLDRMIDIMIPDTDTPGAKAAGVPEFVIMMIKDCYTKEYQKFMHKGLWHFDAFSKNEGGDYFLALDDEKALKVVSELDKKVIGDDYREQELGFYKTLKDLVVLGFCTSETGATETMRYMNIPGSYEACIDYNEGDKAWMGELPYFGRDMVIAKID